MTIEKDYTNNSYWINDGKHLGELCVQRYADGHTYEEYYIVQLFRNCGEKYQPPLDIAKTKFKNIRDAQIWLDDYAQEHGLDVFICQDRKYIHERKHNNKKGGEK